MHVFNTMKQKTSHFQFDRNFCSVHEGYFEWTEQIISINPYKLIQTFFVMILENILIFFKIRQIVGNKFK